MRTCTISSQIAEQRAEHAQRRRRVTAGSGFSRYGSSAATSGMSAGSEQRGRAENRRHGLQEALGLVARAQTPARNHSSVTTVPTSSCSGQLLRRGRHERGHRSPRRRRSAQRRRPAGLSTPARSPARARNRTMSTMTSEQCAEIHKHNGAPDCTRHPENGALDDRHCRCADSVRSPAPRAQPALALDTEFMREKTYRAELVPAADRATAIGRRASIRSRCRTSRALVPLLGAPRRGEDHARRSPGSRSAAARGGAGAPGVRHADRRGARRTSRRRSVMPSSRGGCSAWNSPRRTRAPTGRGGRCPPSSRNTRSTTCATSPRCAHSLLETLAAKGRARLARGRTRGARQSPTHCASRPRMRGRRSRACPRSIRRASSSRRRSPRGASAAPIERNRPRGWILDDVSLREIVRAPAALARGAARRCRRCRNRWCASAARNCWRWCATRASPIRRRRCRGASARIPRRSRW